MNHWLKKHLNRRDAFSGITNNYKPIVLTWENEVEEVVPIIRSNYKQLETAWSLYVNEIELGMTQERETIWESIFTGL